MSDGNRHLCPPEEKPLNYWASAAAPNNILHGDIISYYNVSEIFPKSK